MKVEIPKIPETDYTQDYNLYLNPKELEFWQSVGILPANLREGDRCYGGKLVITRPITIGNET